MYVSNGTKIKNIKTYTLTCHIYTCITQMHIPLILSAQKIKNRDSHQMLLACITENGPHSLFSGVE